MQRLLGAVFIFIGCLGVGYSLMEKERQKIAFIETWENIMFMFSEEIAYKKQSLALAAYEIGKKIEGEEGKCFVEIYNKMTGQNYKGFSAIWKEEWMNYYTRKNISHKEKKMIDEFAVITGVDDEKIQIKMVEEQRNKWRNLRLEMLEGQRERKKIIWTLSACSGVMLILILM